ncbi:MAG: DUF108 domain-containing protein [Deltaproteobacteria bacterium]|nr:DUF108 domain-containing protein [Deltaproteobacteria bacterium]
MTTKRRIGLVGFGKLGQFIAEAVLNDEAISANYELAFVWNRNQAALEGTIPAELQLENLGDFASRKPDVIVEVAHPAISKEYGTQFLDFCDYMVGSPTAFATLEIEQTLRAAAAKPNGNGLYVPRGALPGLEEVLRMVESGKLAAASIAMHKHPSSLKFGGVLNPPLSETTAERVIYNGPLRKLCVLAPNNVNTMAVLAMASELGFDAVQASLVADPSLEHHITEVKLFGPDDGGPRYCLTLNRESPAGPGAVTSTATLTSFLKSALGSQGRGDGVYFV